MDWNMKKFITFLLFLICTSSYVYSQEFETTNPSQSYDFVKLINNYAEHISTTENLKTVSDELKEFLRDIADIVPSELKTKLLKLFVELSSSKCLLDLKFVVDSLKTRSEWTLKMLDSFGKPESGLLIGNLKWVGEYDECVGIQAPRIEYTSIGGFRGRYCTLKIPLKLGNMFNVEPTNGANFENVPINGSADIPKTRFHGSTSEMAQLFTINWYFCQPINAKLSLTDIASLPVSTAVCLPDSCNPNGTIASIFSNIFKDFNLKNFTFDDSVDEFFGNMTLSCKPTTRKLTTGAISVICFLSLFAVMALIGSSITVYEYYTKSESTGESERSASINEKPTINGDRGDERNGSVEILVSESNQENRLPAWLEKSKPFFNCFCVFTNGEKILNVTSSEGQLPSLHGIRFLSMSWVILCHSYAFLGMIARNIGETLHLVDHWFLQIILNGFYSVDSFFLLSGFLVAYLFFQQCAKSNGKIPWVYFYVHRYIRLTPVYAIVILFYTFIYPYLADGPIWPEGDYDNNCHANWWWNLLYINNFTPIASQCLGWSWYLANDMQFYVISPLFLITLWRWPKVGYSLIGIGLCATFVANFSITLAYDSFTGLSNVVEAAKDIQGFLVRWSDFFDRIYTKPYTRVGPYLCGLALAYYLYKWKQNNPKKLKVTTLAAGWALASAVTLTCLFGPYRQNLTTVEAGFYNGLNRIGFGLGLSWVIFVCVIGQGDVVNSLLSWKVWIPLSRLTYCAYLVHPIVQNGYYFSTRKLIEFSHISVILFYLGFLIIAYTAALVTTLLFESPVIRLEKYIRNKFSS